MKIDMHNFQPLAMFNQFTKGNVKIESDLKGLNNHIDNKNVAEKIVNTRLNEALGIPPANAGNESDLFDFEAATKNILNFVTSAIASAKNRGVSEGELKNMLTDAQKGIKEGLESASKELIELGVMNDDIKKGVAETSKQLSSGLQTFAKELFDNAENTQVGLSSYREATHYNLSKDAAFKFTTKEGDQVNIMFNSDYLDQRASVVNLSENQLDYASSNKTSFHGAFSFQVNGELNEDEQQAINELLGSLQNVSDLFFNGEIDEARI